MTLPPPPLHANFDDPKALLAEIMELGAYLMSSPDVQVTWEVSEGDLLAGQQLTATTKQIVRSLAVMRSDVATWRAQATRTPFEIVWTVNHFAMLMMAREAASQFYHGRAIQLPPGRKLT